ncbi:hypothetical protein QBC39DRAFT_406418 [Podospora conica]|nr:hypothetical protein QBC39DRAFT_406418 [Schizothecium conicum]
MPVNLTISAAPSDAVLDILRDEFDGCVFRGVDGFFAKYFDDKPWPAAASKLAAIIEPDGWMQRLPQILSFLCDTTETYFHSEPLSKPLGKADTPLSGAAVYLATTPDVTASNIRVFGEVHHPDTLAEAEDTHILRFYHRALHVFKAQPTRYFLHGFLVLGSTLELWVFDRSGAYSSEKFDIRHNSDLLVRALYAYACMSDEEVGLNSFVKHCEDKKTSYVEFDQADSRFYLGPQRIAAPSYIVGLGTTCLGASRSASTAVTEPEAVVKLSWRDDSATHAELQLLDLARQRQVKGVIQALGSKDLIRTANLRSGLKFPRPFVNRILSCVVTAPRGWPVQTFTSMRELLHVLGDLVEALRSLYLDGRILHRDVAIKNLIIAQQPGDCRPKGVLIDFDLAQDLDNVRARVPLMGSEGFMAIGILSGQKHSYRHDLESLFYVLIWLAIGNNRDLDDAGDIMKGLPEGSRLRKWCGMDFGAVRRSKEADMGPEGFEAILDEFSPDFAPVRGLAKELHTLLFPLRDGKLFTGTEIDQAAAKRLYDSMAAAFHRWASSFTW